MKKLGMLLAMATLSACGGGDSAEKADAPAAEAPATPAAATTAAQIPDYMQGTWSMAGTSCAEGSDTRITVTGSEIRFYESVATVTKVEPGDMESVVVDADLAAEGETSKMQYSLVPGEGGTALSITDLADGGMDNSYTRCPAAA